MSDAIAINASTRLCAVFGHPIRHSASPAMQNAGADVGVLERVSDRLACPLHGLTPESIKLVEGQTK